MRTLDRWKRPRKNQTNAQKSAQMDFTRFSRQTSAVL